MYALYFVGQRSIRNQYHALGGAEQPQRVLHVHSIAMEYGRSCLYLWHRHWLHYQAVSVDEDKSMN